MKDLERQYKKTIKLNLKKLNYIVKKEIKIKNPQANKIIENSLNIAYKHLAKKWLNEEKYLRTYFAKKAIPFYPEKIINLSISLDATINILDDLFDEKLETEIKALYILELLRSLTVTYNHKYNKKITEIMENYFNKIISIAVLESFYKELLEKETDFDKVVELSMQIYDCRSLDMDIYVELPLMNKKLKNKKEIMEISRTFRAVNLIKKDITDLKHDEENQIYNGIRSADKKGFRNPLILTLINFYEKRAIQIKRKNNGKIIRNFFEMIEEENIKIKKSIEKLHLI